MTMKRKLKIWMNVLVVSTVVMTSSCALVDVPDPRNVNIPTPTQANERKQAINERPDSVMYLPLGEDVLVPEVSGDDKFPSEMVGPFELRGETLAGALQLILADYDISLAFETQEGLSRRITVSNLRGDLGKVVNQVCSLADLYCSYEDGSITIMDTETFTVTLPPIGVADETQFLTDVSTGLAAILGPDADAPIVDPTTRTIVYSATQRTADIANRYFQRLRANTAMIVFETYIWEVSLNSGNSMGVDWSQLENVGKYNLGVVLNGSVGADFTDPISIGLPTTQDFTGTSGDLIRFLSQFGAVKTISQPQITVLSGSEAELRVADTQNYVSQIATTLDEGQSTTSVNTDSVDTGFTLRIGSTWDKSTVYANVDIELTNVNQIDDFTFSDTGDAGGSTVIQLPQTSERQLSTQIRVRPGDSLLIAGLVREGDNFDSRGLGVMKPLIPDSRTATTENLELVIMLRPRVVVYTATDDKRYVDYAMKKHKKAEDVAAKTSAALNKDGDFKNISPTSGNKPETPTSNNLASPPSNSFTKMPDDNSPLPIVPSVSPVVSSPSESVQPVEKTTLAPPVAPAAIINETSNNLTTGTLSQSRFQKGGGFVSKGVVEKVAPSPTAVSENLKSPALSPIAPVTPSTTQAPVASTPLKESTSSNKEYTPPALF